jgi:hypothetical protein
VRNGFFVLFAAFTAFFFSGCPDPVSHEPVTEANALVVRITGKSAALTALPSAIPSPSSYDISITRGGAGLGGLNGVTGPGPHSIALSDTPRAGDVVSVEGFDGGGKKCAWGGYALPVGYIAGTPVPITLYPSQAGTGDVGLSVEFPPGSGNDEITAAELSLYQSRADYQAGEACRFMRYRKDSGYGAGTNFTGTSPKTIPITFTDILRGIMWLR